MICLYVKGVKVAAALSFVFDIYELFGFEFSLALSTRPKKGHGQRGVWPPRELELAKMLSQPSKGLLEGKCMENNENASHMSV